MKQETSITDAWYQQQQVLACNLPKIHRRSNAHPIHDTRVAIKKLRAYRLAWLSVAQQTSTHTWRHANHLFGVTGIHREWEMVLQTVKKESADGLQPFPMLVQHARAAKSNILPAIRQAANRFDVVEIAQEGHQFKQWSAMPGNDEVLAITNVLHEQIQFAINQLEKNAPDFHEVRKRLKIVFYLLKLNIYPHVPHGLVNSVDQFLEAAGHWHDLVVVREKLHLFKKHYLHKTLDESLGVKALNAHLLAAADDAAQHMKKQGVELAGVFAGLI